ncbi:MarR family transcriptional regulator, partial [Listeria monocytogenes]|nr:MarR family transcriptional regulator [Listeria monocytogenes]
MVSPYLCYTVDIDRKRGIFMNNE